MHVVCAVAHVLEQALVAHVELAALNALLALDVVRGVGEVVDETRDHVDLGQVEEGVHDVDATLVQLHELGGVQLVDLRPAAKVIMT